MKYFYTDPLSVAWMSAKFGMRFMVWMKISQKDGHYNFVEIGVYNDLHNFISPKCVESYRTHNAKFYIHQDSLHLLEPKLDDIVCNSLAQPILVKEKEEEFFVSLNDAKRFCSDGLCEIIYRDRLAFMCPEREE